MAIGSDGEEWFSRLPQYLLWPIVSLVAVSV